MLNHKNSLDFAVRLLWHKYPQILIFYCTKIDKGITYSVQSTVSKAFRPSFFNNLLKCCPHVFWIVNKNNAHFKLFKSFEMITK